MVWRHCSLCECVLVGYLCVQNMFQCNSGSQRKFFTNITCLSCQPITERCETLPVPSNSLVSPQECASEDSDVISGTVCLYTCVEGYRISIALDASSEVTRTCFQNGTWSDRAPSCVRVCSAQEDPPNGKVMSEIFCVHF